jgi:hypothetical protein
MVVKVQKTTALQTCRSSQVSTLISMTQAMILSSLLFHPSVTLSCTDITSAGCKARGCTFIASDRNSETGTSSQLDWS